MRILQLIFPIALLLGPGCAKTPPELPEAPAPVTGPQTPGPPAPTASIGAYLFASYRLSLVPNNNFSQVGIFGAFADPERLLMLGFDHYNHVARNTKNANLPNVNVGELMLNEQFIIQPFNNNVVYSATFNNPSGTQLSSARWSTEGNKSFVPLDIMVARGFPKHTGAATTFTVKTKKGFSLNMSEMFTAFDSAAVILTPHFFPVTSVTKRATQSSPLIAFTPADLKAISHSKTGSIHLIAFNYSRQVINDRNFVFELAGRIENNIVVDTLGQ